MHSQIDWNLTISDGCFTRHSGLKETMLFVTIRLRHYGRLVQGADIRNTARIDGQVTYFSENRCNISIYS